MVVIRSSKNSIPSLLMAPVVSAAIGMNEDDQVNGMTLAIFLFATASAAAPDVCDDVGRYSIGLYEYDCAIVSVTVTSSVRHNVSL